MLIQILRDQVFPQLRPGSVLIFHGFGLNLLLNAAVNLDLEFDDPVIRQVFAAQGYLVKIFLEDFEPPEYIIMRADPKEISARMARENPLLASINELRRFKFARFEEAAIHHYFKAVPLQKKPHWLEASLDPQEVWTHSLEIASKRLDEWKLELAA